MVPIHRRFYLIQDMNSSSTGHSLCMLVIPFHMGISTCFAKEIIRSIPGHLWSGWYNAGQSYYCTATSCRASQRLVVKLEGFSQVGNKQQCSSMESHSWSTNVLWDRAVIFRNWKSFTHEMQLCLKAIKMRNCYRHVTMWNGWKYKMLH